MLLAKLNDELVMGETVDRILEQFYNMGFPVYDEKLYNEMEFFITDNIKPIEIVFEEKLQWKMLDN